MDNIIINFSKLQLYDEQQIVKIQKWYRGCLYRLKRLPLIMYKIKKYLNEEEFYFTTKNNDGRLNSSLDEKKIIDILSRKFKIKIPNIRMWYDILVYDYKCGFIPVNLNLTKSVLPTFFVVNFNYKIFK